MKLSKKQLWTLAAVVTAAGLSVFTASASRAAGPTYTVCIDIPFHPIFDYVMAKSDTYFAGKPYDVKFKVLDATTQVPAFGAGQCNVMTTPPSFIPRVTQQYHLRVAEFFPLARWTIGPQILVKKSSPYKTLQSLKGKRVAISPLNTRFGSEEAAIEAATGQNIRTYFKLKQTDAAAQELTLGRVDAAFIEAPTTYPLLQSGNFKAIYSVHDAFLKAFGDPAVVNGGYIARTGFIKGAPGFVADLVSATQDAWDKYVQDPKSVNDVASKISGIPAEQLAVVGQVLDLQKMPKSLRAITPRDVKTWSKLFPLLQKSGFIKKAPANPAALFVVTT
ncbi:MAG: transporter substrate-binding domain-containing protein [Actinobacteria bacterium]|nr:MAG: transporter substrate-binding domain-containing protein [Actinomycetota bacterium]